MGSALENTPIQIYAIPLKIFENSLLDKLRAKSISSGLGKFLYCLKNEQWLLPFNYQLFQIHFSINSLFHYLFHLNIISYSLFIYFLTTTHLPTFFCLIPDYYNRKKKKTFEEWTVAHQTWWATVHEPKKINK